MDRIKVSQLPPVIYLMICISFGVSVGHLVGSIARIAF